MKFSKVIFLLILSLSLFSNSIAMEVDSSDETRYNEDAKSENNDTKLSFECFTKLPIELQFVILYLDLASISTGRNIRKRAVTLSLVCTFVNSGLVRFKNEEIWIKLLAAEAYVKGNLDKKIVWKLFKAVKTNDIERIRFLILGNADLIKTDDDKTALISAVINGYTEIVKKLIAAGADFDLKDSNGETALIFAAKNDRTEIVKVLIDAGANLNVKHGFSALSWAIDQGHIEIAKMLIDAGANINTKDEVRWATLITASSMLNTKIVKMLIAAGANLNIINNSGIALIWATIKNYPQIVMLLVAAGADLNIKTNDGSTVLILAAERGYIKIVKILIDAGADLNAKNNYGVTALTAAAKNGNKEIVKMLRVAGAKSKFKINQCVLS